MKDWVFNCRNKFKARDAFANLREIDWDINYNPHKSYNFDVQPNDIVYIRESKPICSITIETQVTDVFEVVDITNYKMKSIFTNLETSIIDDTQYGGSYTGINIGDRFARLQITNLLNKSGIMCLKDDELILKGIIKKGFFQGKKHLQKQPMLKTEIKNVFMNPGNRVLHNVDYYDIPTLQGSQNLQSINLLQQKYVNGTPKVKETISKYIERGSLGEVIKKQNKYECLICKAMGNRTSTFLKKDGIPYIEVHHIEFVSTLKPGVNSLSNLITVCPSHHRQIHYGNVELIQNDSNIVVYKIDGTDVTVTK